MGKIADHYMTAADVAARLGISKAAVILQLPDVPDAELFGGVWFIPRASLHHIAVRQRGKRGPGKRKRGTKTAQTAEGDSGEA